MESSQRSLVPEVPAAEARVANTTLFDLAKKRAYVLAPMPEPKTAAQFAERGIASVTTGDYKNSLPDLDRAIALDPKPVAAYGDRGIAHFWLADYAKARADFEEARRLDPQNYVAEHGFGLLAQQDNKPEEAIKHYSRAIELKPDDSFALSRRANLRLRLKDYDGALDDGAAWFRLEPDDRNAEGFRRRVLVSAGRTDQAINEIDAALARNPADAAQLFARFQVNEAKGDMAAARSDIDAAIHASPSPRYYVARAEVFEDLGLAARRADLEAALKLEPTYYDALTVLADIEAEAGEHDRAIKRYNEALALRPQNFALMISRGEAYARSGKQALAIEDFTRARAGIGENAGLLNSLCWAKATVNVAIESALEDCKAALVLRPDYPAALDSRALVELRLGQFDKAIETYDAALKLAPDQAASLFGRGIAKLRKGLKADGETDILAAKRISPEVETRFSTYGLAP